MSGRILKASAPVFLRVAGRTPSLALRAGMKSPDRERFEWILGTLPCHPENNATPKLALGGNQGERRLECSDREVRSQPSFGVFRD